MWYVYKITNKINNKKYIGKALNVEERWLKHLSVARTGIRRFVFHKAINKYGANNFEVSISEKILSIKELSDKYSVAPRTIRDIKNGKTWINVA